MVAVPQHMQALALANEIRIARHKLKRDIATGLVTAASVVLDPPAYAMTMRTLDLVIAQRQWGLSRGRKLLHVAQVGDAKHLGELTVRQRRVLADLLMWGTA